MKSDLTGRELRTNRNKIRRKAKLDKQLERAGKSREALIKQLEQHNIKVARYLCFSQTKMKIALAEIKRFPKSRPGILVLSWKRFFKKPGLAQIAKDVLGIEKFKEMYLQYVGEKYKEA